MKKTLTILFCFVALTTFAQQKTTSKLTWKEDSIISPRRVDRFAYRNDEGKDVEEGDAFADAAQRVARDAHLQDTDEEVSFSLMHIPSHPVVAHIHSLFLFLL